MLSARLLGTLLCATQAWAALFEAPTDTILNADYDYIIVGGIFYPHCKKGGH